MKKILFILFLLPLLAFDAGEKFLSKIELYQKDSYFKNHVYAEHGWKSFYKLKEANQTIDPDHYDLHLLNAAVFYATNKLREEKKLNLLKYYAPLRDAAVVHTQEMVDKNFFQHYNPYLPKLRSPNDRIKLFGTQGFGGGENIDMTYIPAPGQTTYIQVAESIVDDWLHSPPHRKIMLDKAFTHLGCAAVFEGRNKNGVRYVKATQDFARL